MSAERLTSSDAIPTTDLAPSKFAKQLAALLGADEDEIRDQIASTGLKALRTRLLGSISGSDSLSLCSSVSAGSGSGSDGDESPVAVTDPILMDPVGMSRFVMPEGEYPAIQEMVVQQEKSVWSHTELPYGSDYKDWEALSHDEKRFISHILAFFAASDGIVNENISTNILNRVKTPEVRDFYSTQFRMENVHSKVYRRLLESYIHDEKLRLELLNAIDTMPAIKAKADIALDAMNADMTIGQILFFFMLVEGIMFMGAFISIFWLKKRGILKVLTDANYLISRDEGMHTDFAVLLLNMEELIVNLPDQDWAQAQVRMVVDAEDYFLRQALPVKLIGLNADEIMNFIKFQADVLLKRVGYDPIYGITEVSKTIQDIWSPRQTNFFEHSPVEYNLVGVHEEAVEGDYDSEDDEDY